MRSLSLRLGTPLCTTMLWNSSTSPAAKSPEAQRPSSRSLISMPPAPPAMPKSYTPSMCEPAAICKGPDFHRAVDQRHPGCIDFRGALDVGEILVRLGGEFLARGEDVAHQHARMRQDRAAEHAFEQVDQHRVVLQGVVVLEAIDLAERLQIGRVGIDAEAGRCRRSPRPAGRRVAASRHHGRWRRSGAGHRRHPRAAAGRGGTGSRRAACVRRGRGHRAIRAEESMKGSHQAHPWRRAASSRHCSGLPSIWRL